MRKNGKFAIRAGVVVVLMIVCLSAFWNLLKPKYFASSDNTTATYSNFYDLDEDTVDVIFIGSSHARDSFIPQELYNNYGITSYNLSSSSQSIFLSYYWLKEALKTQSPEVIVVEAFKLFGDGSSPLNSDEGQCRKAIDDMRWGLVKLEAIQAICKYDESQSAENYYLLNSRYHDRWDELSISDFLSDEIATASDLKGYYANYSYTTNSETYSSIQAGTSDETADMLPLMKEYMDKIVSLCKKNQIELILIKTPTNSQTVGRYNALVQYAEENDIELYDLNDAELYEELQYDFQADNVDYGHANLNGALKITNFIGEILQTKYGLESHESEAWEATRTTYEDFQTDYWLSTITDLDEYLSVLKENEDRYTIFIAVKDEASSHLSVTAQGMLSELDLSADWANGFRKSYYAVVENGEVILEEMSDEALEYTGSFQNGQIIYTIASAGFEAGNSCTITINSSQKAKQSRGLNIVVYNNDRKYTVDTVCFDTCAEELAVTR